MGHTFVALSLCTLLFTILLASPAENNVASKKQNNVDEVVPGYPTLSRVEALARTNDGRQALRQTGMPIPQAQKECLQVGGICVSRPACPLDSTVNQTGLCPVGENTGAVCCQNVPESEDSCRQRGGRCGQPNDCKNVQSFGQLDCEDGNDCCLLIF